MNAPKNTSASVKARLQNVAATRGEDFNLLLLRYGIERLLERWEKKAANDEAMLHLAGATIAVGQAGLFG